MKKAKLIKTNKKEVELQQDSYSIKKLFSIVLVLVLIFGIFYFITTLFIKPVINNTSNTTNELQATKITLNNLLSRKENEYYVLATKKSDNKEVDYINLYNTYITSYSSKENALPFYSIDLSDAFNKNYISDELNISDEISEIKLNDEVLFKVKDKKIEKYYVGSSKILEKLSKLKES